MVKSFDMSDETCGWLLRVTNHFFRETAELNEVEKPLNDRKISLSRGSRVLLIFVVCGKIYFELNSPGVHIGRTVLPL